MTYIKQTRKKKTACPTRKMCYENEEAAKQQLGWIHFLGLPWRSEASCYKCSFCGFWHLTSEKRREEPYSN